MGIRIRILQANHGDCVLVTHEGPDGVFNLLIDGGNGATFEYGPRGRYPGALRLMLDEMKRNGQKIDLAILTHIDDDHIGGLLRAFETPGYLCNMVKAIWFNSSRLITNHFNLPEILANNVHLRNDAPQTSIKQGKDLETLLNETGCERQPVVMVGPPIVKGPFTFKILSPDKEKLKKLLHKWPAEPDSGNTSGNSTDYSLSLDEILAEDAFEEDPSVYNGSSIAFILEADDKAMMFLGDSHDEIIVRNLRLLGVCESERLRLDLLKISHHGSQYNTSPEFLSLVNSTRYIISTNGSKHGLPNKRTIARIIASSEGKILFNYKKVIAPLLLAHEAYAYSSRLDVLIDEIRL
jgi:beta-lactamase superfamily II metal-dependent hydrolase